MYLENQKLEARKMGDQKRLTCQKQKVKIRNVANNYEKISPKYNVHTFFKYL